MSQLLGHIIATATGQAGELAERSLPVPAIRLWACLHSSSLSSLVSQEDGGSHKKTSLHKPEGNLFLSLFPPPGQSPASLILFPAAFRLPSHMSASSDKIRFPKGMFIALCECSLRFKRGTRHSAPPGSVLSTNEEKHQMRRNKREGSQRNE